MTRLDIGDIAVHDFGGAGPAIIMCHATGFHGAVWRQLATLLSDSYHCYALDFRGHGDTPQMSSDTPQMSSDTPQMSSDINYWEQAAQDLVRVATVLSAEPILAVGHSMGAACIALGELHRPGTFKAGWLFEPILLPQTASAHISPEANPLAIGARKRREIFSSRQEATERYASRPPLDSFHPTTLKDYVEHGFVDQQDGSILIKCRGAVEASVFESAISGSLERVRDIKLPLHVARGVGGGPAELAPRVVEMISGAKLETFAELSHFGPLENPQAVAKSIHGFFSKITASA